MWPGMTAIEKREAVRKARKDGLSCSQIARLYGATRSAVAGLIWRMYREDGVVRNVRSPKVPARRDTVADDAAGEVEVETPPDPVKEAEEPRAHEVAMDAARPEGPESTPEPDPDPVEASAPIADEAVQSLDDAPPIAPDDLPEDLFPADAMPGPIQAMRAGQCRFMPGGPEDLVCCGAPVDAPGSSWCAHHRAVVYVGGGAS